MKVRPQAIFSFAFVIFFIVFVYEAQEWRLQARLYPWAIGVPMLILAIIQVILDLKGVERKQKDDAAPMDFQFSQEIDPALARKRTFNMFGWLLGLMVWLIASPLVVPAMFSHPRMPGASARSMRSTRWQGVIVTTAGQTVE